MAKKSSLISKILKHRATKIAGGVLGAAVIAGAAFGVGTAVNKNSANVEGLNSSSTYEELDPSLDSSVDNSTDSSVDSSTDSSVDDNAGVAGDVVSIESDYYDLINVLEDKTNYNIQNIQKVEVENGKLLIVGTTIDNKNRETAVCLQADLTEDQLSVVEESVASAYEKKEDKAYANYISTVAEVLSELETFNSGIYKEVKSEALDFTGADVYALMNAYYLKNNDKENAVIISNNFENATEEDIATAELKFVKGAFDCEVSAVVGDLEMTLSFDVEENSNLAEVKEYVSATIENFDVAEITGVEYSYNKHEKVIGEINSIIEENKKVEDSINGEESSEVEDSISSEESSESVEDSSNEESSEDVIQPSNGIMM